MNKSLLFCIWIVLLSFCLVGWADYAFAESSELSSPNAIEPGEKIPTQGLISVAGDFDASQVAGADYLKQMQADITDDNAGNGVNGVDETPDDPDDGGWDWSVTSPPAPFHHTTAASPQNIYGATIAGLYYAYLETADATYFTAMTDAANVIRVNPNIRTASDCIFLMNYNDLPGVVGTSYMDSAKAKFDARIASQGSPTAFAQYIRDVRNGQGYGNGIIAWDIGFYVVAAAMLDTRYPGDPNNYAQAADDMAEVLWQDSFNDNPGYFDVVDDAGWDPTYADRNFWWYTLGLTGLIDAFDASGSHTDEIPGLVTRLLDSQYPVGGISGSYGANAGDEDWQSTAYAMMSLGKLDQTTYQDDINRMAYWTSVTQDASGGWVYSSGSHYPEIGGECTAGLYFSTNDLTDVLVDDSFTSQGDVDIYNTANGTDYVWGYDAFATIQEGIDAVNGSTVNVMPGTYREQLYIDKSLDLVGSGTGTCIIEAVDLVDRSTYSITQWNSAVRTVDAVIGVYDAGTVNISGFSIDGRDLGPDNFYGIHYFNTDGSITNCIIDNITFAGNPSAGRVVSLLATHGAGEIFTIDISADTIPVFQKGGIVIMGPGATFTVDDNYVSGVISSSIAGNCIQLSYGASGSTSGNYVEGTAYTGSNWASTGILLFESGDITMNGDEVYNCESGVNFSDWGWVYNHPSPVSLAFNNLNLHENEWSLGAQLSRDNSDPTIDITGCDILNSTGDGIDIFGTGVDPWGGGYYTGWNNGDLTVNITDCNIRDAALDGIWTADLSGNSNNVSFTVYHTDFTDNIGSAFNNTFTQTADATECYWNSVHGPVQGALSSVSREAAPMPRPFGAELPDSYDPVKTGAVENGLVSSVGETIYGPIDYDPWCSDETHTYCTLTYPVTDVWVDDDWAGSSEGDVVGGHIYGYDAFATIQEGVDAVTGSTVNVSNGTYLETLNIYKNLTLIGESETGVIIDASGFSDYGMDIAGDYTVSLQNFTLIGPTPTTYGYGIKASGENADITISNVTSQNCGRSGIDLNGVVAGSIQDVSALSNGGVGLALTDCENVTVSGITTSGNAWGGIGIYTQGTYHSGGSDNITITGSNSIAEIPPIYTETGGGYPITNLNISISDFPYTVGNNLAPNITAYFADFTTAAAAAIGADPINSFINQRSDGRFVVPSGLTIQAAVTAASPGDLIDVMAGVFVEQVHVTTENLTIQGSGVASTFIQSPVNLTDYFVTGTNNNYPVVFVDGVNSLTLNNLTVDGDNQGDTNYRFSGIGFWNGGGTVSNVNVLNVMNSTFSGAQHGIGVYSYNDGLGGPYNITLLNVFIDDFQKNAIALGGDNLTVDLDSVTVIGEGPTGVTAQNGIQVGHGAGGTVTDCSVTGIGYTGSGWVASGMLFMNGNDVTVNGNCTITNSQANIIFQETNGSVTGASITTSGIINEEGVSIRDYGAVTSLNGDKSPIDISPLEDPWTAGSGDLITTLNTTVSISNCTITGVNEPDGYGIACWALGNDVIVDIQDSDILDWEIGLVGYESGSSALITANGNSFIGNDLNIWSSAVGIIDAEENYWGSVNCAEITGLISGNVDFEPWCTSDFSDCTLTCAIAEVWVDDDYTGPGNAGGHIWTYDAFDIIQDGVNTVISGGLVHVAAGMYEEQVLISKELTMTGAGKDVTIIQSPVALTEYFTTSDDNYPIIYIHDIAGAVIESLTVDGLGRGNGNYRFVGIGYLNAGGDLLDVRLTGVRDTPFSGAQHGVSVYSYIDDGGPYTLNLTGVDVDDMQKTAFALSGVGLTANVVNCTTAGAGPTTVTAQNGIQIGYGATGSITGCEVSGMNYTGPDWSASGILLYYPDPGMILSNNNVHDCQGGLNAYFADGMLMDSCIFNLNDFDFIWGGDSIVVTRNTFTGNGEALYIADATNLTADENSFDGNATAVVMDGLVDNVTMSGNDIINSSSAGIVVVPYGPDEPVNVAVNGNNISGNAFGLGNTTTNMVDATANWWGDATGPDTGTVVLFAPSSNRPSSAMVMQEDNRENSKSTANPRQSEIQNTAPVKSRKNIETITLAGSGDKVSALVDYSPWWGDNYVDDLHSTPWNWHLDNTNASTIQEGVDMASDYDSVHVTAGTYSESVSIIKPIKLMGDSGAVNDVGNPNLTAIDIASSDVTVNNLTLSNCRQGILVWLDQPEYSISPGYTNISLTNNTISNTNGSRGFGIYVGTESERYNPADPLGIYDPSLTNLLDFSGLHIFNNTISNTSQAGVVLQSIRTVTDTIKVKFNEVSDTPYSGIWIDAAINMLVCNNALHECGYGVFMSDYADGYYEGSPDDPYDPKDIFFGYNQVFNNNYGFAVYDCWPSHLTFYHNRMMGHANSAVYNFFPYDIDATYNYWGSDRGPTHPGNPYGDGDPVSDYVLYDPWCNYDFTICGHEAGDCEYVVGDVNGDDGYNGLDIVYGVSYLKGGPPPAYECECTPDHIWYVSGDVNASCTYNGLDITYGVAFFKGGPIPQPCPDCPPIEPTARESEQPGEKILIGSEKTDNILPELK